MKQLTTIYLAARGRLRSYGLLALIMLSVVTSIGIQLTNSQTALAASGVFASGPLTKNITDYALRNAVSSCLYKALRDSIPSTEIASGNWFKTSNQVGVTHLYASDDGKRECATAGLINDARAAGGWGSNIEMACAAGFTRSNGSNCINGTGNLKSPTQAWKKYQEAFDAKRKISFSDAMYYLLYARSMEIGCKATPVIEVDKATPDQKTLADSDKGWSMKVVGADGKITNTIYKAELGRGRKITTTQTPNTHDTQQVSCIDLVKRANQYANAYAAYMKAHPNEPGDTPAAGGDGEGAGEEEDTCKIDGVGWIICPVMTLTGKLIDQSYQFVAEMLRVQPLFVDGQAKGVYDAWSIMRNVANVAFVVAFLIIIFSQVTSVGIGNYGIKRMLPRLIVAAVLVNISYWICAIAVDASNIAGKGMMDLFNVAENSYKIPESSHWSSGEGWEGLVGLALAGAIGGMAALYLVLSALVPVLLPALLAIITVLLVLMLRQALIILLIVIAPLAFVAYLLPNTEQYFKKWRQFLQTLLLMYPVISLIFGASALASKIVMGSADHENKLITIAVQIMGAGISIIPLFITPVVMKAAGGVLNRFGGIVNNPNKGPFDRMRKGAQGFADNRREFRRLKAMNGERTMPGVATFNRRKAAREAVLNNRKTELNRARAEHVADLTKNDEGFRAKLAAGGGAGADMRALAGAINVQAELEAKEVKAASAVIENMNLPFDQLKALAQGNSVAGLDGEDSATRRAAIQAALTKSTVGDAEDIVKSSASMTAAQRQDLADGLVKTGITKKATHLGGKTLDDIAQGKVTTDEDLDNAVAYHFNKGKYSAEAIAEQDGTALKRVVRVAEQGAAPDGTAIDYKQKEAMVDNANKVLRDTRLSSKISSKEAAANINAMAGR